MVEESSPLLPPTEEPIEAETDALDPERESGEPAPEPASGPPFVCDCEESMRSACTGLAFYKEHEGKRYCVLHYPDKEKSADFKAALDRKLNKKDFDFRGVWFPDFVDFRGFEFSAAANFRFANFNGDANFSFAKFNADSNFRSANFSAAANFRAAKFANASFSFATFRADVSFQMASFSTDPFFFGATFAAKSYFSDAMFTSGAHFYAATFCADAYFIGARLRSYAEFGKARFSRDAYFSDARFSGDVKFDDSVFDARVDFARAAFNDTVRFLGSATERQLKDGSTLAAMALGKEPSFDFQDVRIERLDRIAFHTLNLRPHWFVNVDSRQFVFTDVGWEWDRISIKQEIAALEANEVSSPNRLLAIACRQLAENAESNNRYEEASRFRYWAMDLARHYKWRGAVFWKTDWLHMLYWAVSGYGERILRGFGVLAAVWIVFVLLYTRVGFAQPQPKASNEGTQSVTAASMPIEDRTGLPLEFSRALTYSLAVMSLQKPEPKPLTGKAQTLVLLETILGPVQAALLALAIRRKFMR